MSSFLAALADHALLVCVGLLVNALRYSPRFRGPRFASQGGSADGGS